LAIISYNRTFSPAEIDTVRSNVYQNPVVPTLVVDGTDKVFESNINAYESTFTSHIRVAQSITPIFNLHLEAQATTTIGDLEIKIVAADTVPNDTILAFVAVCQDSIHGLAKDFNYVCQKLYSFPVYLSYTDSLDTIINFIHSMPVNKMTGVLFVQDINTKKVLQAIKTKFTEVK
jgi:hypothetical protein